MNHMTPPAPVTFEELEEGLGQLQAQLAVAAPAPRVAAETKTTITIEPMRPDVWRLRINISTYDAAGKRIARDQKYTTVKGSRDDAEMERYKRLLNQGVAQAAKPAVQIARDVTAEAAVSDMTLGQYAEGWLERRLQQATQGQTASNIKAIVRLYVLPAFGHLKLSGLCRDQILAGFLPLVHGGGRGIGGTGRVSGGWDRSGLSGRALSPRTIRHALIKLMAIVSEAAEAGLCSTRACDFKGVKKALPRTTSHKNAVKAKALNDEQTKALRLAVRDHWLGPVIRFALASGCRRGEMCALQWNAVTFQDPAITKVSIHQSLADDFHHTWIKEPKTEGSVRDIIIAGPIVRELAAMKAEAVRVAAQLRADVGAVPVFPNTRGQMMNPGDLSDQVRAIMADAGLDGFSLHSTRHTHASTLLRQGENIAAVSKRLGHSDPGFTLRVYSWAMPSEDVKLAQTIARAMGGMDEDEALELEEAA